MSDVLLLALPLILLAGSALVVYLMARLLRAPNALLAGWTAATFALALLLLLAAGRSGDLLPTWGRRSPGGARRSIQRIRFSTTRAPSLRVVCLPGYT